jgi:hypothetical protein
MGIRAGSHRFQCCHFRAARHDGGRGFSTALLDEIARADLVIVRANLDAVDRMAEPSTFHAATAAHADVSKSQNRKTEPAKGMSVPLKEEHTAERQRWKLMTSY